MSTLFKSIKPQLLTSKETSTVNPLTSRSRPRKHLPCATQAAANRQAEAQDPPCPVRTGQGRIGEDKVALSTHLHEAASKELGKKQDQKTRSKEGATFFPSVEATESLTSSREGLQHQLVWTLVPQTWCQLPARSWGAGTPLLLEESGAKAGPKAFPGSAAFSSSERSMKLSLNMQ